MSNGSGCPAITVAVPIVHDVLLEQISSAFESGAAVGLFPGAGGTRPVPVERSVVLVEHGGGATFFVEIDVAGVRNSRLGNAAFGGQIVELPNKVVIPELLKDSVLLLRLGFRD